MARSSDRLVVERLRAALVQLPARTREVYRLTAMEGLGMAVVARRLGLDDGEAEALLAEAIVRLDAMLGEDGP